MKKLMLIVGLSLVLISPASAFLDDNSTNQNQGQTAEGGDAYSRGGSARQSQYGVNENDNRDYNSQGQGQDQGQGQAQAAIAAQGQMQGTVSNQEGNDTTTEVNTEVQGDTNKNKTYANAWPSLSGGEGVSQANGYSIFGGIGLSDTEEYKKIITEIQAVEASKSLDAAEKEEYVSELFSKMMNCNKKQRLLGVLWETSGRNLLNGFGLLSWDSFWK